jgi:hypothetical protein
MRGNSNLDLMVEAALAELEAEFESEVGQKYFYTWRVFLRREFGGPYEPISSLDVTKAEQYTPDAALVRHSAVVQMAYKTLKNTSQFGDLRVERQKDGRKDGCSTASVEPTGYLRIEGCWDYPD